MKTRHVALLFVAPLVLALPAAIGAAAEPAPKGSKTDILPPPRRQPTVDAAERLTRTPTPAPVAADLKSPFNPPDYSKPDPNDPKSQQAAPTQPGTTSAPAQAVPGDKELLESLAARLPSTGTISLGGKPMLIVGKNRFEIGTKFTVAFNGQDYELELVAIDRTTFTLRFRGEETTRPIRSVK
jgi:hypothetical protein